MSYQEGMQIGNMGMNFARTFMMIDQMQGRQQDRGKKLQSEANIEKYIPMVQQGKEPDRKAKDFSYTDYLSAQTKVQQNLNADVGYQNNVLVKEDNQRKANQSNLDNMIASSKIYADQGDAVKAAEIIAPIYNFFPDGTEFVRVNPENRAQWVMKDQRTNKEYAMDAVPYNQASAMAKNFSKKYQDTDKSFQEKRRTHNNLAIVKRDIWKTPDGKKEAYYFPMLDKNGAIRETWKDTKTGEVLKGFDVRTGQNVESDLNFRSPEYFEAEAKTKKGALERRGKIATAETAEVKLSRLKAGAEKPLTLPQRQKRVDGLIDEQLANKLLNDPLVKNKIKDLKITAADVLKNPSAHLFPDRLKLYQKTKELASKYSKDMPIQEAIQKAETEAQISTGDDLVSKFVAIKNPEERKAFAQNLKESDPELFAFFQEASKRYDIKKEKKTMKDKNYPSDWKGSSIKMRP